MNNAIEKISEVLPAIIEINSKNDLQQAIENVRFLTSEQKRIKDRMQSAIDKANKLHKELTKERNNTLKPYAEAEEKQRNIINSWLEASEQLSRERLDRIIRDAKRRAEEDKKRLIAEGFTEAAEMTFPEVVGIPEPDIDGITRIPTIDVKIVDLRMFLEDVIKKKYPVNLVKVDMTGLKKFIKNRDIEQANGLEIKTSVKMRLR